MVDPLVKVYDIRMAIRSLAPIPFPSGPVFLKMHPRLSTTVFIVSQSGQFQVCDVTNVAMGLHTPAGQFYQIPTSSYVTSIDVSSSGETVAIGDASSFIFQYADRQDYSINAYSDPLDAPDQPHPRPNIIMDDSRYEPTHGNRSMCAPLSAFILDILFPLQSAVLGGHAALYRATVVFLACEHDV
jgi:PAB-dependent poly(A)-specific ribonuclease subunit 2